MTKSGEDAWFVDGYYTDGGGERTLDFRCTVAPSEEVLLLWTQTYGTMEIETPEERQKRLDEWQADLDEENAALARETELGTVVFTAQQCKLTSDDQGYPATYTEFKSCYEYGHVDGSIFSVVCWIGSGEDLSFVIRFKGTDEYGTFRARPNYEENIVTASSAPRC